ncbi:MAG: LD-carboxypeptidase [Spirochaetales bacterium]|nr:LD-carboxypeptidase [Spirochaetales bacterium]
MLDYKPLKKGDKVAFVSVSNGRPDSGIIEQTAQTIRETGLEPVLSPYIYRTKDRLYSAPAQVRAENLMQYYRDPSIKAIFDVGGGDLANQILEFLDFGVIGSSGKEFWGFSDLSTMVNAIYAKTGRPSWLYQIRKLANRDMIPYFENIAFGKEEYCCGLPREAVRFVRGNSMSGTVLGGNIRCFMKLNGTPYFPDLTGKILVLESLEGTEGLMTTLLWQYRQMGVFRKIKGLIVGSYTALDKEQGPDFIMKLVMEAVDNPELPIAKTDRIGHNADSYALHIGDRIELKD